MVQWMAKRGPHAGRQVLGMSALPRVYRDTEFAMSSRANERSIDDAGVLRS